MTSSRQVNENKQNYTLLTIRLTQISRTLKAQLLLTFAQEINRTKTHSTKRL